MHIRIKDIHQESDGHSWKFRLISSWIKAPRQSHLVPRTSLATLHPSNGVNSTEITITISEGSEHHPVVGWNVFYLLLEVVVDRSTPVELGYCAIPVELE